MNPTPHQDGLPALPEPAGDIRLPGAFCLATDGYTADQMRAYALAAMAAQPLPAQGEAVAPVLVRDLAAILGSTVPDVCLAMARFGRMASTNMAVSGEEALLVAGELAAHPKAQPAIPMTWDQFKAACRAEFTEHGEDDTMDSATGEEIETALRVVRMVERHHGIAAMQEPTT